MMLCCVCLLETPQIIGIFDDLGIKLQVAEVINKHLWFKPQIKDALTSHVCTDCWNKLSDFHEFYVTVEKSHISYKEIEIVIKEEPGIEVTLEKDEEYEDNIVCDLRNPLNEDEDEIGNNGLMDIDYDSDYNPSEEASDQDYKVEKKAIKIHQNTSLTAHERKKSRKRICNKTEKNANTLKKKRKSHRLDLPDEMVKKHIQMGCDLCIYVGKNFHDIIEHFKDHHDNVKPYIMCCDKKFTRTYSIAQHACLHEDPNYFSCTECNKSFTTSYGLRIHRISYHSAEEERLHACEHCPKKFGRRNLLELHRQKHIPKDQWTIICTQCTNRTAKFATQYLLNIHTSMYHRREINICQVCAKEIKDKKSFEKHVRSHFEDSGPRLKCPIENCESWLKDEDNLKTHIQRYHIDDKTYKCPDCDKVCQNRRSLSSHKHYFHSKEVFRCEQCDKTFKKALTLKEHMTQHTGETLYNCPFCTRTFNSNANMHSHKKKQHPLEWEEQRKKKLGILPNQ